MRKRIFNLFGVLAFVWFSVSPVYAVNNEPEFHLAGKPLLYEPDIDRKRVHLPRIDSEFFEIGPYAGLLSVEDFGANVVTGVRLNIHPVQWGFVEGAHGNSSISDETYRRHSINLISAPNGFASLTYSYVAAGLNIMPGEVFIGRSLAFTSGVYVLGGAGATEIDGHSWRTFVYGLGLRVLPVDWIALHLDMRGYEFKADLVGRDKMTHNIELNLGAAVFF